MAEYTRHLARQYADRCLYWQSRALSRLRQDEGTITLIADAMDKSKYRYPRSRFMGAKEFSALNRPALSATAIIAHGRMVIVGLTESFMKKDSSLSTELVSHALHMCSLEADVRGQEIILQSDNSGRETKNNTTFRFAALQTAAHKCRRFEMRFLESGHSHEDVDQYFSTVSGWLEKQRELWTPEDFAPSLRRFHELPETRQHEPKHYIYNIDQVRDWSLGGPPCNL